MIFTPMPFAERQLWNFRAVAYSALMPAVRITLVHLLVSSAMNLRKSSGAPVITTAPSSANRALSFGSARAELTSLLSLVMISAGVFLGAHRPVHRVVS